MSITEQIHTLHRTLPTGTTLVAVSKFHPVEALREAYDAGQRIFGESRVQELLDKKEIMPKDIEWHFIGHLQQNKVKYIVPFVSLIHGVDSPQLFREIDKQGRRFELTVEGEVTEADLAAAREAADKLLSNPIIEDVVSVRAEEA